MATQQQQQQQEAEAVLERYIASLSVPSEWPRVQCCDVSRFLYCPECCRLLIPRKDWPTSIQNGTFRLPFSSLHVILRDRKTSATGLHAITLLRAAAQSSSYEQNDFNIDDNNNVQHNEPEERRVEQQVATETTSDLIFDSTTTTTSSVSLFDIEASEDLPDYETMMMMNDENDNNNNNKHGSVYLLYPDETSVPLSSVTGSISTLVVLDFTWQRRKSPNTHPALARLPRVHLTSPPMESRYWRWHNAGPGMVSTIEALFYASWEIAQQQQQQQQQSNWSPQQTDMLVDLLWLFGLQRYLIATKYSSDRVKPLPFTPDGKEVRRAMYRTVGTDKHDRDIERGKILKKEHIERQKKMANSSDEQQPTATPF